MEGVAMAIRENQVVVVLVGLVLCFAFSVSSTREIYIHEKWNHPVSCTQ